MDILSHHLYSTLIALGCVKRILIKAYFSLQTHNPMSPNQFSEENEVGLHVVLTKKAPIMC